MSFRSTSDKFLMVATLIKYIILSPTIITENLVSHVIAYSYKHCLVFHMYCTQLSVSTLHVTTLWKMFSWLQFSSYAQHKAFCNIHKGTHHLP
jgi:hypothetical protein